jgi:TetR/AcrR family transcriptional regulator
MNTKRDTDEIEPKQRIMDAAIKLFARKGFAATGMRELSKEAGVNLAMINYYFGSKQKILEEIIDEFFKEDIARKEKIFQSDANIEEKLRLVIADTVKFFRERQDLLLVAITEFPFDVPEITDYKANYARQMFSLGSDSLASVLDGQLDNKVKLEVLGPSMMGMVAFHFILKPVLEKLNIDEFDDNFYDIFTETITNILLYGLLGQPK